jgi:hypothetical protein
LDRNELAWLAKRERALQTRREDAPITLDFNGQMNASGRQQCTNFGGLKISQRPIMSLG